MHDSFVGFLFDFDQVAGIEIPEMFMKAVNTDVIELDSDDEEKDDDPDADMDLSSIVVGKETTLLPIPKSLGASSSTDKPKAMPKEVTRKMLEQRFKVRYSMLPPKVNAQRDLAEEKGAASKKRKAPREFGSSEKLGKLKPTFATDKSYVHSEKCGYIMEVNKKHTPKHKEWWVLFD